MLNIQALRIKDTVTEIIEEEKFTVDSNPRKLPENSTKELPEHIRLYAESRALPQINLCIVVVRRLACIIE